MANFIRRITGEAKGLSTIACVSVADLQNIKINSTIVAGALAEILGTGIFAWDPSSTAVASSTVIVPNDGTNPGRWLIVSSSGSVPTGAAGGDLGGTYPNPDVLKIHGSSVPIGGSLTTGNVLQVSGAATLTYAALNLAGGAGSITGTLPVGNGGTGQTGFGAANTALLTNGTANGTVWALIANANVDGAAAIAGTKISPNFGNQNVLTTGTITGGVITGSSYVVSASGPTITTGASAPASSEVDGSVYLRNTAPNGSIYIRNAGTWVLLATAAGSIPTGPAGGDLGGTYPNPDVLKIHGSTVPAGGALTTSTVLQVSGSSTLTYALIVNANVSATAAIAGTKISPDFGNQNIITTGSITTTSHIFTAGGPTITTGSAVPSSSEVDGSVYLRNTSPNGTIYIRTNGAWIQLATAAGTTPTGAAGGDLGGTYPNPIVVAMTGTTNIVAMHGTTIRYDATVSSPTITQAIATSSGQGQTLSVISQAAQGGSNSQGGSLLLQGGAGDNTGNRGVVQVSGSQVILTSNNGGAGQGVFTDANNLVFRDNGQGPVITWTLNSAGATNAVIATGATSPTISQANNTTNSATAQSLTLQAQNATGTTATGGAFVIKSGTGTTAAGSVSLRVGATESLGLNPTGAIFTGLAAANDLLTIKGASSQSGNYLTVQTSASVHIVDITSAATLLWGSVQTPIIKQTTVASGTGAVFTVQAQNTSSGTGGNLVLSSGTGTVAGGNISLTVGSTESLGLTPTGATFTGLALGNNLLTLIGAVGQSNTYFRIRDSSTNDIYRITSIGTFVWGTTISPFLSSDNKVSGTGNTFTIASQASLSGQGGQLTLRGGAGTTSDGYIDLQTGTTSALLITPVKLTLYGAPTVSTGTAVPTSSEVDGSFYLRTGSPNGSAYIRTNGAWVLLAASGGSTPTGPAGGDLSGTYPNPIVVGLTGTTGTVAIHGSNLTWDAGVSSPTITQTSTGSNTGNSLTIQAQTAGTTGGTLNVIAGSGGSQGGSITIRSGSGTINGSVSLRVASTEMLGLNPSGAIFTSIALGNDVLTIKGAIGQSSPYFRIRDSSSNDVYRITSIGTFVWGNQIAPFMSQDNVVSGTGNTFTISAQRSLSGAGGQLTLQSGVGTTVNGNIDLQNGSTSAILISPTKITLYSTPTISTGTTVPVAAEVDGSIYLRTGSPNGSIYVRTNGAWVLVANTSSGAPPSGAAGGDLSGTYPNPIVVGLTGIAGTVAMHGTSIQWDAGVANPSIFQAATGSATGANLFLQAQDAATTGGNTLIVAGGGTGGGAIGGNVVLQSGLAPASSGIVLIKIGLTEVFRYSGTSPANMQIAAGVGSPTFFQADQTGASTNGQPLTIQAQNATGTTSRGGFLTLKSGTGTTVPGEIQFLMGAVNVMDFVSTTQVNLGVEAVNFISTLSAPFIFQGTSATNSATGKVLTIAAQNMSGTNTVGGDLSLSSGSGTVSSGAINFVIGGVQKIAVVGNSLLWNSADTGPTISQIFSNAAGTGQPFSILAQNMPSGTGGALNLSSGTGLNSGNINFQIGGTTVASFISTQLDWAANATSPVISQIALNTSNATGQAFLIQSQSMSGTNSTGGQLILASGSGTNLQGDIIFQYGGVEKLRITKASGSDRLQWHTAVLSPLIYQSDVNTNSTNGQPLTIQAQTANGTSSNGGILALKSGAGTTAPGEIQMFMGTTNVLDFINIHNVNVGVNSINFVSTLVAPGLQQLFDSTTNNASGQPLLIKSQTMTGTNTVGGDLNLSSGSGTVASGTINFEVGAVIKLSLLNLAGNDRLLWSSTAVNPGMIQNFSSTNNASGQTLSIIAQSMSGTTSSGGNLILSSGSGTSGNGSISFQIGLTNKLSLINAGVIDYLMWEPTAGTPTITQGNGPGAASNLKIIAQTSSGTSTGGNVIISGGSFSGAGTLNGGVLLEAGVDGQVQVHVAESTSNRRVLGIMGQITSSSMPANTGDKVIFINNSGTVPTANAVGGGILYVESGSLKWRNPSGVVTTLAL